MFLVSLVDHYYQFSSNLRAKTMKMNYRSPYWPLGGDRCVFWSTTPIAQPINKARMSRRWWTWSCLHCHSKNVRSVANASSNLTTCLCPAGLRLQQPSQRYNHRSWLLSCMLLGAGSRDDSGGGHSQQVQIDCDRTKNGRHCRIFIS